MVPLGGLRQEACLTINVESVCTNQDIVLANIRSVKISSPDYATWDPDAAVQDYMKRITEHERHYEPVEEMDIPWIRLVNVGEKIQINKIQGYLQSKIVFFLMNIHNRQRFIYFARVGPFCPSTTSSPHPTACSLDNR